LNSLTNRFYDFISNWRIRTMKTLSASLKALVVASLACAAGFAAAAPTDSQTLTVNATVVGTCKFSSATNTLAFGNLDQSATSDTTLDLDVTYKCTKNTASAGISIPAGGTMTGPGGNLPFTLAVAGDTAMGGGLGTAGTLLTAVVTGTIAAADVQAAEAGTYSTTVTLTITN
jgi:spore coat protein U-like protein